MTEKTPASNHTEPDKLFTIGRENISSGSPNNKTPAEIEIIEKLENKWKEKWLIRKESKVWWEKMLKEAVEKGIELGRKESEELEHSLRNTIIEKLGVIIDLKQQLSNKEKEIIEKIENIKAFEVTDDLTIVKHRRAIDFKEELIKQIEGEGQ